MFELINLIPLITIDGNVFGRKKICAWFLYSSD